MASITGIPTADGEMIWEVRFTGSYYDGDERGPGYVSVDERVHVLAVSHAEALRKAEPHLAKARKRSTDKEATVTANPVALENFVAARDSSGDRRMGWIGTQNLKRVELTCPADTARYRLAVCLVPVERE